MCVCVCVHITIWCRYQWSENNMDKSVLSFIHVNPKSWTQILSFARKSLYLLSHLIKCPKIFFHNIIFLLIKGKFHTFTMIILTSHSSRSALQLLHISHTKQKEKKSHVKFVLPIKSSAHGQTSNSKPLKDKCVPLWSTLETINFEKLHFSFFITIFKAIFNGFLSGLLLLFGGGKVVIEAFNVSHSQLWISRPCADTNNCLNFVIAATLSEPMAFCNPVF